MLDEISSQSAHICYENQTVVFLYKEKDIKASRCLSCFNSTDISCLTLFEPCSEKTSFLHIQKQRGRSAAQ